MSLFEIVDDQRIRCTIEGDRVKLHDGEVTRAQAAELARMQPDRFSPGAALRPIVQDAVLPTLAYIGGPSELVYLWQIGEVYSAMHVERSTLYPRCIATLIDQSDAAQLERFGLAGAAILDAGRLLEDYDRGKFKLDDDDLIEIEQMRDTLLAKLDTLDPDGQEKLLEKARQSIDYQVGKLADRLREQRLARSGRGKGNLKRLVQVLEPMGKPQERVVSVFEWIGRYGEGVVECLTAAMDPAKLSHQLIVIDPRK
jgi:uncharacterized protein YllA (UPF0747 family)